MIVDLIFILIVAVLYAWLVLYKKFYIKNAIKVQAQVVETEYSHRVRNVSFKQTKFEFEVEDKKYNAETKTGTSHKVGNSYIIKVDPLDYSHVISVKDFYVYAFVFIIFLGFIPFILR